MPSRPTLIAALALAVCATPTLAAPPDAGTLAVGSASPDPSLAPLLVKLQGRPVVAPDPRIAVPAARTIPVEAAPGAPRPGLSARQADGSRRDLPLEHTRFYAQVEGNVARVEVTQFYRNDSAERLEAVYAFPLPENAAVTDMILRIGPRVVASEVRRRDEARQVYERARQEGKTAALTEQERPNLFTQSVANVPPGEQVAVVLRYVHEVPFDSGRYLFTIPTTVGPRYVPGAPTGHAGPGWSPDTDAVPDASRVTPPVLRPGVAGHDLDVVVRLVPGDAFGPPVARDHRIVTGLDGDGARLVALAEDDRRPDRDFVLAYAPTGAQPEARALVEPEQGEDYLMLFVQPPADVLASQVRPREVVFLVDVSGSMSGRPLDTARALVVQALERLGPRDTFQIITFAAGTDAFSPAPLPGTPANVAAAEGWLARLRGGGGTEMLAGIRAALASPADPARLRLVVFCTDGFIGNEPQVIQAVQEQGRGTRVFGFGIGSSVNRYLIEGVARAGRGAADYVDQREDPGAAVARLYRRLDRPVLTDLELQVDGRTLPDAEPERLPDLFAGQPLVVVARAPGATPARAVLTGRLGTAPWRRELRVLPAAPAGAPHLPAMGTLWARRRIEALTHRSPAGVAPGDVEAVVALALRFKLVTAYTSFVAVEHEARVDPASPLRTVAVPGALPVGVSLEGIFGPGNEVAVVPARVKPGDPEIRVQAPPTARAVRVLLPFGEPEREAVPEGGGAFAFRFLVPPGLADGTYQARITIVHDDGRTEVRTAPIHVDTTPAAVAVVRAADAAAGGPLVLELKPALPAARAARALGAASAGDALRSAMDVKEILVRAPWGEVATARMGALGVYRAELTVPRSWPRGRATLEVAASDAAGNVSRRTVEVRVGGPGGDGLGLGGALAAAGLLGLTLAWRTRRLDSREP